MQSLMNINTTPNQQTAPQIHNQLCQDNFWYDTCSNRNCPQYHIRRRGDKLILFDAAAHLNRLHRKDNNSISNIHLPTNCELYINDMCLDPEDWGKVISFKNPNINIARSLGFHSGTSIPSGFGKEALLHFRNIYDSFPMATLGSLGLNKTGVSGYDLEDWLLTSKKFNNSTSTPIYIQSSGNDEKIHKIIQDLRISAPIIWQNINQGNMERCSLFTRKLVPQHPNYNISFNGRAFENRFAHRMFQVFHPRNGCPDRLVLETSSPHNQAAYYQGNRHSIPLHMAGVAIEFYKQLQKTDQCYRNLSLADANDLLTHNGFSLIPKNRFTSIGARSFETYTNRTLGELYRKHKDSIHTIAERVPQPKPEPSVSTKRSAEIAIQTDFTQKSEQTELFPTNKKQKNISSSDYNADFIPLISSRDTKTPINDENTPPSPKITIIAHKKLGKSQIIISKNNYSPSQETPPSGQPSPKTALAIKKEKRSFGTNNNNIPMVDLTDGSDKDN